MVDKKYKFVVFDFDGVVCDSTNECMVTSWNSWNRWNNGNQFRNSLNQFSQAEIDAFKPLRPYVRGAQEYYIVMRVINSSNLKIHNQQDFEKFTIKWEENLKPFQLLFFKERKRLKKVDSLKWIKLHYIYSDVITVMKTLNNENRLLIATLKDSESVQLILKHNGIDINSNNILDQSKISSKLEALDYFIINKEINKEEICFLDDNVTHLIEPKNNNFIVYLTGWGATIKEHKDAAIKQQIPILEKINEGVF